MKDNLQFETWPEALTVLCQKCEAHEIGLTFCYDPGWSVKRINGEWSEPELNEDQRGYSIEVGNRSFANDDESRAVYKKPSYAVYDGWRLLKSILEERGE